MTFTMNDAWSRAVALFRENWQTLLILAGIFVFLPQMVLVLAMPEMMTGSFAADMNNPGADPGEQFSQMMSAMSGFFVAYLVLLFVQLIGQMAMTATAGDRVSLGQSLSIGMRALPTMLGVLLVGIVGYFVLALVLGLIVGVVIGGGAAASGGELSAGLGLIAFVVGIAAFIAILYVASRLSLLLPVVVLHGERNPFAAFAQSWRLTKPVAWKLVGYYVLLVIAYFVIAIVVSIVFGGAAFLTMQDGPPTDVLSGGMLVYLVISAILSAVVAALLICIVVAVYDLVAGTARPEVADTFD